MEEERILLGSWLLGDNLDDMNQFETTDFINYGQIYRLLKEGNSALEIARKANIPIVELAKMQSEYRPFFYRQIFEAWQKQKVLLQISKLGDEKDVEAIKDRIDYLLSSDQTVKENSGWVDIFTDEIEARATAKTVNYGLPTLDKLTGGVKRKELTALAARPAVGKSAIALNIGLKVADQGQKVLYFPLEMSTMQTLERIVLQNGLLNTQKLRSGKMEIPEREFARDLLWELEKRGTFKIYESVNRLEQIEGLVRKEKPFLIIIDQLTQMRASKGFTSVRERFSYMTNNLKELAMKENIAILLLCQINRNAQDSQPSMADLKESGSIEEDSDNIILLHRLNPQDADNPDDWIVDLPVMVSLEKQRSGETGRFVAAYRGERFKFYERARDI